MAVREIVTFPAPILRSKTELVQHFTPELHTLLDDMQQTMYSAHGIGLAAPQVGIGLRVAVIDTSEDRSAYLELVNPQIVSKEGEVPSEEGCLSIPDYRETITRHARVTVRAQDRHGKEFEFTAGELLGICAQHEIDHLEGVLFIDHMSRLKRALFNKWLKKNGGVSTRT
ncbi:MAG: peptide deformylase [Proteobacteria bacterium]|nr:peptide deformylase [Pseudomonadota bacterium]